jgi:uncharacterized protein YegL
MNCPACSFDYGKKVEDFNFCPKCGERLPELAQLSPSAWRRIQLADLVYSIARLVAPGILGAGIALWFMGPAWFVYTETRTVRVISVVLMLAGPLLFFLAFYARKLAEDMALSGLPKNLEHRPANIYLLLDISGSMGGGKLSGAKKASESFFAQLEGDKDQVGLITFSTEINEVHPLGPVDQASFVPSIHGLEAGGTTALYDAVIHAIKRIQELGSPDRSNVILALTDGKNQGGEYALEDIGSRITEVDIPVSIFTVAYGWDADMDALEQIAQWGNGQAYKANRRTIKRLYELLSAFF